MSDLISRQDAIDAIKHTKSAKAPDGEMYVAKINAEMNIQLLPSAEPERKTGRLSNKEWIDFLVEQFNISRTSAKDMLHVMMQVKREDNFKKQFSGAKIEVEHGIC